MADTGYMTFGAVGTLTDSVNTSNSWSNATVSNLNTSNASVASYTMNSGNTTISRSIRMTNPVNIATLLPDDTTITGYEVQVQALVTVATGAKFHRVQLVKSSVVRGNNVANSEVLNVTDTYHTFGGEGNTFGATLTVADVEAAGFGVEIQFKGGDLVGGQIRVNLIHLKIYYSTSVEFNKSIVLTFDANQVFSKNTNTTLNASELFTKNLDIALDASELFVNTINTAFNSAQMITKTINTSINALSEINRNISLAFNSLTAFNKNQELQLNSSELFQRNVELQLNASMAWIKNVATSLNSLTAFTQNIVTVFLAGDFVIPTNPNDVLPVKNTNPHVKIDSDGNITPLKVNKIIDFSNPNGTIVVTDLE